MRGLPLMTGELQISGVGCSIKCLVSSTSLPIGQDYNCYKGNILSMDYFPLILAMFCFIYGLLRLIFPNIPDKDLEKIPNIHKRILYSKLCGTVLLIEGFWLVVFYILSSYDMLRDIVIHPAFGFLYILFVLLPIGILVYFKRKISKKS